MTHAHALGSTSRRSIPSGGMPSPAGAGTDRPFRHNFLRLRARVPRGPASLASLFLIAEIHGPGSGAFGPDPVHGVRQSFTVEWKRRGDGDG